MTASQNLMWRRKSSTSLQLSPEVGHGIGRGLPNEYVASLTEFSEFFQEHLKIF